ncbi:Alpha/Beta hydrolase protein [Penicillium lagena]|uniref:Alpha/Beta hydrolase protein n=1 Tax=Penicillium lagena TaxID=94218 RepID=UPI00253FC268|nr:Alpha/Beta hydrolase protein [Penicillium lagena]KAJ5623956.1 Alpha/Beta hydrolase protein [Penicillium lagena]
MDDYSTKEAVLQLGILDPILAEILKASPVPKTDYNTVTVEQMRHGLDVFEQTQYDACPVHGTRESTMTIPMRDGYESELRVIQPPSRPSSGSPLVVLLYGGGFFLGTNLQFVPWGRAVAALYGATVVLPSYRLAPEHKFPTGAHDVSDTMQWLAGNAASLGADLSQGFVLGGGSAGGNLAIVAAHRAVKEQLSPPLTGLFACLPVCMSEHTVPEKYKHLWLSREQNALGPNCTLEDIEVQNRWLEPDEQSEDWSPFNSDTSFAAMPPTYVQVCGKDTLRDDGLIYEKVLRDHGVQTKLDVYPGMPHGHFMAWTQLTQSLKANVDAVAGIGWLLGKDVDRNEVERVWNQRKPLYR